MEVIESTLSAGGNSNYKYKYKQKIENNKIKLILEIEIKKDCNKTNKIKEDIKNKVLLSNKEIIRKL